MTNSAKRLILKLKEIGKVSGVISTLILISINRNPSFENPIWEIVREYTGFSFDYETLLKIGEQIEKSDLIHLNEKI